MKYGYFDDERREYIITNPKTPLKWINYVGTLAFGGLVDHTGGSLICQGDPALNRIVKYIPQLPASEFKGETLYLRFKEGDDYKIFSPFFVPTLDKYNRYECHVGLGYTRIVSEFYGIRADVTIFVPQGDRRVIRDVKITNQSGAAIELDAIPVVEYSHFDALKQFTNADWVPQTMQSKAHHLEGGRLALSQYAFMRKDTHVNYLTCNLPVSSFESERRSFLGDNEYGTWVDPLSLHHAELADGEALRGDNIGALLIHLGTLQPGETRRFITQLGQEASIEKALPGIKKYWDDAAVDAAFNALKIFWDGYLNVFQVQTPDVSMNAMLNVHNPRQCHTTKNWSRYLSLYQLGLGARGIGFRDSSQDVLGVLAHMPEEAKALIVQLLSVQQRNGSAMHQFYPATMEAFMGDSADMEDRPPYYSDDHLWIVQSVCGYIKETGDLAFLDEIVPYYEKGKSGQPIESGTVLDHMQRAVEFTHGDVGQHGLPLAGFADWNDTVNLPTGGESVFTAHLYGVALKALTELATYLGDTASAEKYAAYHDEMKGRVNDQAWDGEWYVRYFEPNGSPIGSHVNDAGKIYCNAQTWSVLAGFAPPERARQALDSVNKHLNTPNGIKVSAPGYNGFDPNIGGISTFPPGAKENGGIFQHVNPWVIIAETLLGDSGRAYQYYSQLNPAARNDRIDEYECEPYAYAQNVLGDNHPRAGAARNSWLTGTASWMYQAATQYILGIKPTYIGLQITPCIPADWDGFSAVRQFRGVTYTITVKREGPGHDVALEVDGQPIDGTVIPLPDGKSEVDVVAILR